jgi:hypothetical protein
MYLVHLTRYIHLNPVKAGLVKHPGEWEFSSYREYAGLRQGTLPKLARVQMLTGATDAYQMFLADQSLPQEASVRLLMLDE